MIFGSAVNNVTFYKINLNISNCSSSLYLTALQSCIWHF